MIELLILSFVLLLIFGPPLAVTLLPTPWWRPVAGWSLLAMALLWLDERNIPFERQGMMAGVGTSVAQFESVILWIAIIARVTRSHGTDERSLPWMFDWQLPAGFGGAVFFFHFLANRLAGSPDAGLVHLVITITALAAAVLFDHLVRIRGYRGALYSCLLAFFLSMAGLILWSGYAASRHVAEARKLADGRPFCLISHAGRERQFQATSRWQLSPLVSRRNGRSWIDDEAPWLTIDSGAYRMGRGAHPNDIRAAVPNDERTSYHSSGPFPCNPQFGGGIVD